MNYDYIGVIGHDHCGSTVYCRLLSALEGVESGGELHWLVDVPVRGEVAMRAGWTVSRRCAAHGSACEAFTPAFVEGLARPKSLYAEVKQQLGAEVLVSTDKYPRHFERFVGPGEILGVVLFKHPYAAVTSDVLTNRRSFEGSLDLWADDYERILDWAPRFCRRVIWQPYYSFAMKPAWALATVAAALEVDGEMPAELPDCHFIGGNPSARGRSHIALDDRWCDFLDKVQLVKIQNHSKVKGVFEALLERAG